MKSSSVRTRLTYRGLKSQQVPLFCAAFVGVFQFLQEKMGGQDLMDFGWPNMFRQHIYRTERNKWPEEKLSF